jgi:YfiH family protein
MAACEKGVALCVKTADCVPVLLADRNLKAVAAVHAGWRGTSLEIVSRAVAFLGEKFGIEKEDILAAVGPAIRQCCYEVDAVVHDAMAGPAKRFFQQTGRQGKWKLDLPGVNRHQLMQAGVPPQNISDAGLCTACSTDMFFSHRSEKKTGRQINFIMIENKRS